MGLRFQHVYLGGSLVASQRLEIGGTGISVTYRHTDALGSPIAATDAAGSVVQTTEHEPYGRMLNRTNDNRPGYTGHVMDQATGMVYMQQRYYDPQLGVFLSVDPVTAYSNPVGQFHRYRYANNNPYKFVDPDGRVVSVADESQRKAIEANINSRALGVFKFDDSGNLQMVRSTGDSSKFSQTYQTALVNAIESDKNVAVSIAQTVTDKNTGQSMDVDRDFGGGVTGRTADGAAIVISGNTNSVLGENGGAIPSTGADALMHEFVGHALPEIGFPGTGNGIQNENQVRGEIGLPLRRELPHPETR